MSWWTPPLMKSNCEDIADPLLYRTYWKLMCEEILHKIGFDATKENKAILHDFHKRILGYKSIAGRNQEVVSIFMLKVTIFWGTEFGLFICTSKKQKGEDIENLPLSKCWQWL